MTTDKSIYYKLVDILESSPKTRRELIDTYIASLPLTKAQRLDKSTAGVANINRSTAGTAINEMLRKGIITRSPDGIYTAGEQKPIIIQSERCESAILDLIAKRGSASKADIKEELVRAFGTERTISEKDDNFLFSLISQILERLVNDEVLIYRKKAYSLSERVVAKIDDINGVLKLKESFRSSIYKNGGEFFEYYFMTLLGKYLELHHKKVVSNTVTAGSADGGIDGILETTDPLGFRETIMVQTKNRAEMTIETDVRSFYGAVCAKQGSRGIYAITSSFHSSAKAFLDSIDNCVGIDGDMLFKMAMETGYGLKKCNDTLCVDDNII